MVLICIVTPGFKSTKNKDCLDTPLHTGDHTWFFKSALFPGRHLLHPEAGLGWSGQRGLMCLMTALDSQFAYNLFILIIQIFCSEKDILAS